MTHNPSASSSTPPPRIITTREDPRISSIVLGELPADDQIIAIIPLESVALLPKFLHFINAKLDDRGSCSFEYEYLSPVITLTSDTHIGLSEIHLTYILVQHDVHERVLIASLDRSNLAEAELWLVVLRDAFDQLYSPVPQVRHCGSRPPLSRKPRFVPHCNSDFPIHAWKYGSIARHYWLQGRSPVPFTCASPVQIRLHFLSASDSRHRREAGPLLRVRPAAVRAFTLVFYSFVSV